MSILTKRRPVQTPKNTDSGPIILHVFPNPSGPGGRVAIGDKSYCGCIKKNPPRFNLTTNDANPPGTEWCVVCYEIEITLA